MDSEGSGVSSGHVSCQTYLKQRSGSSCQRGERQTKLLLKQSIDLSDISDPQNLCGWKCFHLKRHSTTSLQMYTFLISAVFIIKSQNYVLFLIRFHNKFPIFYEKVFTIHVSFL